jgi:hypothetical protein
MEESLSIRAVCDPMPAPGDFLVASGARYWKIDDKLDLQGAAHFQLDIKSLARNEDKLGQAMAFGEGYLVAPEALLPLPPAENNTLLRIEFELGPELSAISALPSSPDGSYALQRRDLGEIGPFLLGRHISVEPLPGDSSLRLAMPNSGIRLERKVLFEWVSATAKSNRRFWRRSPVEKGLVILVPAPGSPAIPFGRALSVGGVSVAVLVGEKADARALYDDWVLTHELIHLGSPIMRDTGAWLNEGIATFYEPVIRARAGWKTEDDVWREWISQMPRGLRAMSDIGLSNAGRGGIYWGGAIFVLMAEIEALSASGGRMGFSDCLRLALDKGGNTTARWTSEDLISLCDAALGSPALSRLFALHVQSGSPLDLAALWRRLGVSLGSDGKIAYAQESELAWVRPLIIWGGQDRPEPISSAGFFQPD